jgi:hypothetical protein
MTCEHGGNHVPPRYRRLFRDLQGPEDASRIRPRRPRDGPRDVGTFERPRASPEITHLLVDLNPPRAILASTRKPFANRHVKNEIRYLPITTCLPRTCGESGQEGDCAQPAGHSVSRTVLRPKCMAKSGPPMSASSDPAARGSAHVRSGGRQRSSEQPQG